MAARVAGIRTRSPTDKRLSDWPEVAAGTRLHRADVDIAFPLDAIGTDLSALMTIAIGGVYSDQGHDRHPHRRHEAAGAPSPARIRDRSSAFPAAAALTGVEGRPIIGTIVKPALGLRPHETAELVGELIESGVDFIKDDEKLMSPAYSPLKERVAAIMPRILDHEQKTGKKVMYAFGISHADPDEMMRNHDIVAEGGRQLRRRQHQLDRLRRHELPAQALRPGAARASQRLGRPDAPSRRSAWTSRSSSSSGGCSALTSSRSTASAIKYWEPDESFVSSFKAVSTPLFDASDCPLPVAGSGQWGGQAPETYQRTGRTIDLLYLCGGGIVSHPGGPAAGVRAVQQAWQAAVADIPLGDLRQGSSGTRRLDCKIRRRQGA